MPVTVTVNIPVVGLLHESVEVPEVPSVTLVGVSVHVSPAGDTVAVRLTVPGNPFTDVTVTVDVPATVTGTLVAVGLADTTKSWTL